MTRLFAHHPGRHCRHGSLTGWSSLSLFFPTPGVDFARQRVSHPDLIPFTPQETR